MKNLPRLALAAFAALTTHAAIAQDGPEGAYVGILPCADCPGIEVRLDILDDGAFHQRSVYQERNSGFDAIGRWEQDGGRLRLHYQNGDRAWLALDEDALTLLDAGGKPIESNLNYTLHRSERLAPIEPQVRLDGHFTYYADSAQLADCTTGRKLPVAMRGDYLRMERAWNHARATLENPLPVIVQGRIVNRPNMEGPARPMLEVERLISAGEPVSCSPRQAAGLFGTQWVLRELIDQPVADAGERAAYIEFADEMPARVSGSTGCNRFSGNATLTGGSVLFGALASTKMACLDSDAREQDFLAALEVARNWRIHNGRLELLDAAGRPVAVFTPR